MTGAIRPVVIVTPGQVAGAAAFYIILPLGLLLLALEALSRLSLRAPLADTAANLLVCVPAAVMIGWLAMGIARRVVRR